MTEPLFALAAGIAAQEEPTPASACRKRKQQTLTAYLARMDAYGAQMAVDNAADIDALLGRSRDAEEAHARLVARIGTAGSEHDEELLRISGSHLHLVLGKYYLRTILSIYAIGKKYSSDMSSVN